MSDAAQRKIKHEVGAEAREFFDLGEEFCAAR